MMKGRSMTSSKGRSCSFRIGLWVIILTVGFAFLGTESRAAPLDIYVNEGHEIYICGGGKEYPNGTQGIASRSRIQEEARCSTVIWIYETEDLLGTMWEFLKFHKRSRMCVYEKPFTEKKIFCIPWFEEEPRND